MKKNYTKCNVALLTGRGGSSFRNKNIFKINGNPLLGYPCIAANKSKLFDYKFCSSDDQKILSAAEKYNFKSIKRPKNLSTDRAKHEDVIIHALKKMKKMNIIPDTITVLMANCATITSEQLITANIKLLSNKQHSSVTPVINDQDHHPFRARKIKSGRITSYFNHKSKLSSNRQELISNYFFTHSFWTIRLKKGKLQNSKKATPWEFMGKNIIPLIVDVSIDVHDYKDILITKEYLSKKMLKS